MVQTKNITDRYGVQVFFLPPARPRLSPFGRHANEIVS